MDAALAFAYRPTLEPHFQFPDVLTAEMAQAFVAFMESELIYEYIIQALPKYPAEPFAAIGNTEGNRYIRCGNNPQGPFMGEDE